MYPHHPSRAAGLAALAAFTPAMGRAYADQRNHDLGPGRHRAVSQLSPHIRRRLVTEAEVVAAALAAHGPEAAEKFIQEVIWRGYFKGWLEQRPQVWASYRTGLAADLSGLARDPVLAARVTDATQGRSGIECLDAWALELTRTGYLHNHARMWFASIWIFTLRLPWRLGADFFLRHLLDGDPASNTLGWRWVAGLHTRGKPYAARADNIARYAQGRFTPAPGDLADVVTGLEATEPAGLPPLLPLRRPVAPDPSLPTLLLITEEDCTPEFFAARLTDMRGTATLAASRLRSPLEVSGVVTAFEAAALADAAARLGVQPVALTATAPAALADAADAVGACQIATAYIPQGPLAEWMQTARPILSARGIALAESLRDWDSLIWPRARAGFFTLRAAIPDLLARLLPA